MKFDNIIVLHKYSVLPGDSHYIMSGSCPQVKLVQLDLPHTPHPIIVAPIRGWTSPE